jgi:membrane associated rhomboid family serine protease
MAERGRMMPKPWDLGVPRVTYTIIFICVALFLLGLVGSSSRSVRLLLFFLVPDRFAIWGGAVWGLATSTLVHGSIWHLVFNMWWARDFGRVMEPRLGVWRYLLFVVSAGVLAGGAQLAFSDQTGIGFSGVVYAQFGFVLAARHVVPAYAKIVNPRTIQWLLGWLVLCIVMTQAGIMHIANAAHVAGFCVGYFVGNVFVLRTQRLPYGLGLIGLTVLTVLSVVYMPWSEDWVKWQNARRAREAVIFRDPGFLP